MNYKDWQSQDDFREADCCATCLHGYIWNDEEIECKLHGQEVSFWNICNSFEREAEHEQNAI